MNPLLLARLGIVAGIALAGGFAGWTLNGWRLGAQIGPLQAEVSRLQASSSLLEGENARCAESAKSQNEAVERLLAKGQDRAKKAEDAAKKASIESASLATTIATIRATTRPADDSCPVQSNAAAKVISDEIRTRR
jgi:hypothetical protein